MFSLACPGLREERILILPGMQANFQDALLLPILNLALIVISVICINCMPVVFVLFFTNKLLSSDLTSLGLCSVLVEQENIYA